MTRGKIIFIDADDKMYSTCEFNGEMHPDRNGQDVIEHFQYGMIQDKENFMKYIRRFIKRYYPYENDTVTDYLNNTRLIDITDNWTDYLYIINQSASEYRVKTKEGEMLFPNNSVCVVRFHKIESIIQ